ncbi:uncharacterized protein LOC135206148 isoform X2 [Macrobrachium nipponense]|uniref:uncharacterized protein LOC135206148 isoform X2 n=1 Tax=Macrobrachium nipponense TaxID=159736 RepID=UPI0030C849A4
MATGGPKILFKGKTSISWMPEDGPHSLHLSLADYRVFHKIAKTVHLDEFEVIKQSQSFPQQKLSVAKSMCHLVQKGDDLEFIMYGVVDPKEATNIYGNVSFVLDMTKFLSHFQHSCNIYYVETVDFKRSSVTHILVTTKRYDYLTEYDPRIFGGPWFIDPAGRHYWLSNARRFDRKTNAYGHKVEFLLELGEVGALWLYNESVPIVVDHQKAHVNKRHICLRNRKVPCPSPYDKKQTQEKLVAQGFTLLENEVPSQLSSSGGSDETAPPQVTEQSEQLSGVLSGNEGARRSLF